VARDPVLPWRTDYYGALKTLSFKNVEAIIFDQMLPRIANYWTRSEMESLTHSLPSGEVDLEFVQGNSWHACVRKKDAS
jgi:hypothetical protein